MPFDEEDLDPHGECAAEIARLRAERDALHRTIWLLVKENGGAMILNKDTKEDYPATARVEITEQAESGCSIFRACT